jgi:hypothetical protein
MKYSKDAPWWYNERALLSVFVGAVWQNGEEAFEEFSELKRRDRTLSPGRVDLWFSSGRWEFWAEAKHLEIPITRSRTQTTRINAMMDHAKKDVRKCAPDGFTRRLALVFCMPYLRPCTPREMNQRLTWLLEQADDIEHDALAWVFPNLKRLPKAYGWVSPGIIVWIKEVRR